MKKSLINLQSKTVGDIDLDSTIFGIKKLPDLIHQYIRYQNAKSRQGSHKTKSRSEVSGRSKKPFCRGFNFYRMQCGRSWFMSFTHNLFFAIWS